MPFRDASTSTATPDSRPRLAATGSDWGPPAAVWAPARPRQERTLRQLGITGEERQARPSTDTDTTDGPAEAVAEPRQTQSRVGSEFSQSLTGYVGGSRGVAAAALKDMRKIWPPQ